MSRKKIVTVNKFISITENGIFFDDSVSINIFQTGIFRIGDITPLGNTEVAAAPETLTFFVPYDTVCALKKILAERSCARLFRIKLSDIEKFEIMSFTGGSHDVTVGEKFSGMRIGTGINVPDDFFVFDADEKNAAERVNTQKMCFIQYDFDIAGGEPKVIAFAIFGVVHTRLLHNGVKFGIETPEFCFRLAPIFVKIINHPFRGALITDNDFAVGKIVLCLNIHN